VRIAQVYSHPRSGTHFLMVTLWRNFCPSIDLAESGVLSRHWAELVKLPPRPYTRLFGGHGLPSERLRSHRVYIYRDRRDVAVSLWKAKSMMTSGAGSCPSTSSSGRHWTGRRRRATASGTAC
jgi:bile-salt sulfotransferase